MATIGGVIGIIIDMAIEAYKKKREKDSKNSDNDKNNK